MAKESVVIIDYGSGNLRSAAKAFEHVIAKKSLNAEVKISNTPEDLYSATRIVLPGQGAFGDCINGLRSIKGMVAVMEECVLDKKIPFLGICVGMQLLAETGFEHGMQTGLGWIEGKVVPMRPDNSSLKIPHMGWNEVYQTQAGQNHTLLRSIEASAQPLKHYYFVHSFVFECKEQDHLLAVTEYGGQVPAIIGRDNILGVQFHPEKSQDAGLNLIAGFMCWEF